MSFNERVPEEKRTDETEQVARDADAYAAVFALSTSEGGRILIESLRRDITASIDKLAAGYANLTEPVLRAECANLNVQLNVLRTLTRSKDNLDGALAVLDELIA
jgi:hypothetical protein